MKNLGILTLYEVWRFKTNLILTNSKKKLQNKDYREFLKFSFDYEKQLYPELAEQEEIDKQQN